jgi:hypothetical protein
MLNRMLPVTWPLGSASRATTGSSSASITAREILVLVISSLPLASLSYGACFQSSQITAAKGQELQLLLLR